MAQVDAPAWIQAGSGLAIVGLTVVLARVTASYARQTQRMADLMARESEWTRGADSRMAAAQLLDSCQRTRREFDRRIQDPNAREIAPSVDAARAVQGEWVEEMRPLRARLIDPAILDRLDRVYYLLSAATLITQDEVAHAPAVRFRISHGFETLIADLDAYARGEQLPACRLPHPTRAFDYLGAPPGREGESERFVDPNPPQSRPAADPP